MQKIEKLFYILFFIMFNKESFETIFFQSKKNNIELINRGKTKLLYLTIAPENVMVQPVIIKVVIEKTRKMKIRGGTFCSFFLNIMLNKIIKAIIKISAMAGI